MVDLALFFVLDLGCRRQAIDLEVHKFGDLIYVTFVYIIAVLT
jgi:hypothetical protein